MRIILAGLLACAAGSAAGPTITELQPRGADLSRPFTLTVVGRGLGDSARITSTMPASFTAVTPPAKPGMMAAPGRTATFLVEPKPDAAPGVYPIRLETPAGLSNILLFTLGTYPEVTEEESQPYAQPNKNDTIENAEAIRATPIVVNGTLRGPERDMYRVYGKGGEWRVFEVEARRCGSAVDPVLRILDPSGRQLARSNDTPATGLDARIEFTFPREGYYYVEVTDARFSAQAQNFYRLKMGSYTFADGIFPLGGRRGEKVPITFFGGNLKEAAKATLDLTNAPPTEAFAAAALKDSPAIPFVFAVSDLPELIEPAGDVPVPSVVNGRLAKEGEISRYHMRVQPGEHLLFELQARELGTSKLEGIITVYDAAGKKLDSGGDKPLPEDVFAVQGVSRTSTDPFLNFTVPDGVQEITVTVEDLALRGGPAYAYRLITRKQAMDFHLSLGTPYVNVPAGGTVAISVSADRRGYDGPIHLTVPNLPKGLHLHGGMIPKETVDASNNRSFNRRGVLTVTADPGVTFSEQDLEVWGEGTLADGSVLRRRARGPGMMVAVAGATAQGVVDRQRPVTAPWLSMSLPAAPSPALAATLEVQQTAKKDMAEGARYEFAFTWKLRGRTTPPRLLNVDVVGARDIRVIDMQTNEETGVGSFAVTTTKATDPAVYDLIANGTVKTEDGDEVVMAVAVPFEVTGGKGNATVASAR